MTTSSRRKRRSPSPDPRTRADFVPKYYPKVDGQRAPTRSSRDRNDRIKLQFLAAYYRVNRGYANLLEAGRKGSGNAATRERRGRIAMQKIESALRGRDALEDKYASYGVIAEPVLENGFTVNVKFSFGSTRPDVQHGGQVFSSSAYISIPLPPGVRLDDLRTPAQRE